MRQHQELMPWVVIATMSNTAATDFYLLDIIGLGGIAYQLMRAHPEHELPSVLIPIGADNRNPVFHTSTNGARCLYVSHGSPVKRLTWLTSLPE